MIRIHNLHIAFAPGQELRYTDHDFAPGLVHGIIGLNGAGKTTFFNLLAGFLKPTGGTIEKDGLRLMRAQVGYLETANYFYSNITGREYLEIFPVTNGRFSLDTLNELMRLPLDHLTETYSTGMKKRLALMAILQQDKPVYIFDEPFNGLDLETSRVLQLAIRTLRERGKTIFLSSHILESLTGICDAIHLLKKGVFTHTYLPDTYANIHADLFDGFDLEAADIVARSL